MLLLLLFFVAHFNFPFKHFGGCLLFRPVACTATSIIICQFTIFYSYKNEIFRLMFEKSSLSYPPATHLKQHFLYTVLMHFFPRPDTLDLDGDDDNFFIAMAWIGTVAMFFFVKALFMWCISEPFPTQNAMQLDSWVYVDHDWAFATLVEFNFCCTLKIHGVHKILFISDALSSSSIRCLDHFKVFQLDVQNNLHSSKTKQL